MEWTSLLYDCAPRKTIGGFVSFLIVSLTIQITTYLQPSSINYSESPTFTHFKEVRRKVRSNDLSSEEEGREGMCYTLILCIFYYLLIPLQYFIVR